MENLTPFKEELIATAKSIVRKGFGIIATDENERKIGCRFSKLNIDNTEENRRKYRELLFTTPGIEEYISGVILNEEILDQSTQDGKLFIDVLKEKGVTLGIKVHSHYEIISGTYDEIETQGLDKVIFDIEEASNNF